MAELIELTKENIKEVLTPIVKEVLAEELIREKRNFIEEYEKSTAGRIIKIEQNMATKEDIAKIWQVMATKEDIAKIWQVMATKEDIKNMATKEGLIKLEERVMRAIAAERFWLTFITGTLLTIFGLILKLLGAF